MATPTPPSPDAHPTSNDRARLSHAGAGAPRGRVALAAIAVLAVALVASIVGCSSSGDPTESAAPAQQQVGAAPSTAPTTEAPVPDVLADPGVAPGECKLVTYTPDTATAAMGGELCRPKENQRDVAIMVIHGGSGIGGSYANMRRWANRYIAEGYVTFLPQYYLFGVGGESPVFPHPEQNIKAAVQFLRGTGNAIGIDKDRIVVQGQSAGARVGAVAYTTPDDLLFKGPELYPDIPDTVNGFIGFYHPYDGTMQYADQYFGGSEFSTDPKVQTRLDKGDSLGHANDALGPALFITGSDDWEIIDQQQEAFAAALRLNGYEAESVIVPGGGHGFDEGGATLSRLGEQSAEITLRWLNDNFPQTPAREAQVAPIDVNNLPAATGTPPTTYQPRTAPSGGYVGGTRSGGSGGTSGNGGRTPTTVAPTSAVPTTAPPPTEPVVTTAPPTTSAPPTSTPTIPPTEPPPPTTVAPPPTTAVPSNPTPANP
jgi:acetyl esterase/lipase